MRDYEDSFETSTTAPDGDEETSSVHTSSTLSTAKSGASAINQGSGLDVVDLISEEKIEKDVLTSSTVAAFSTTAEHSPVPLAGAPATVPIAVPIEIPDSATQLRGDSKHVLHTPHSLMPKAQASKSSVGAAQKLTSTKTEGDMSSESLPGSEESQSSVIRNDSDTVRGESKERSSSAVNASSRRREGVEFEALSQFVAFRGSGSDSILGSAPQRQSSASEDQTPAFYSSTERLPTSTVNVKDAEPRGGGQKGRTTVSLVSQLASMSTVDTPQKTSSELKEASVTPSSVFSTISQHLQQQQPQLTTPPVPAAFAAAAVPSLRASVAAAPATRFVSFEGPTVAPAQSQAPKMLDFSSPPAPATETQSPRAGGAFSLPALPPPGWSSTSDTNAITAATTEAPSRFPATTAAKGATSSKDLWMIGDVQYRRNPTENTASEQVLSPPPPLAPHGPTQEQSNTSELREASEAVERLVRAFALLKGYIHLEKPLSRSRPLAADVSVSAEKTAIVSSSARWAGRGPSVQVRDDVRPRGPRYFAPVESSTRSSLMRSSASHQGDRERLAEDLVLDCVLGMLEEHSRNTATSSANPQEREGAGRLERPTTSSRQTARPQSEVVTVDAFAYSAGALRYGRTSNSTDDTAMETVPRGAYTNPSSTSLIGLCGSGTPLFDPRDRQSAVDLYNVVREALEKYVLRRVVTGTEKAENLLPRARSITVVFAWTLLLDAMNLCEQIARVAYGATPCTASAVYPVLAQFKGDTACEEVAKAAMHCLPFEALSTTSGDSSVPRDGVCIFRMACWVTQQQLWTIADALADTVREDMVRRSKSLPYSLFNMTAMSDIDPRVLVPPSAPMFTLRPLPGRKGDSAVRMTAESTSASGTAASYRRVYEDNGREGRRSVRGTSDNDFFEVPTAALQRVAYHVSLLATDLLSDMGTPSNSAQTTMTTEDYPNAAATVSETLSELLQDESIKAAVKRRAAEKFRKAQMERTDFVSSTRLRKEQIIIEKAEKEAEEVVQCILQEMRAQGVA